MAAVEDGDRSFLLLHGWRNRRPVGHWHRLLADALLAAGHQVLYPQLPEPDEPVLGDWTLDLYRSLAAQRGDERVLVCHSLAVLLWWQAAPDLGPLQPDRVLLVAPPSPAFVRREPSMAAFAPDAMETTPLDPDVRRRVRLVVSDADPYCPEGPEEVWARPHALDTDVIPGAGHLNPDAGYGPWPSVLAWCSDPSVRITGRDG